jgi:hypothetical protein
MRPLRLAFIFFCAALFSLSAQSPPPAPVAPAAAGVLPSAPLAQPVPAASAQSAAALPPAASPTPPPAAPPRVEKEARAGAMREYLEGLTQPQKQKVTAAIRHVWDDPDVGQKRELLRQAYEAYKKEVRDAIQDVDPEVQALVKPIFEKSFKEASGKIDFEQQVESPGRRLARALRLGTFDKLTEDEKNLLNRLWEKVKGDPRFIEADQRLQAAASSQDRTAALAALTTETRHIAVELDQAVAVLWEKYPAAQ